MADSLQKEEPSCELPALRPEMENAPSRVRAAFRILCSVGPFLTAQSNRLTESYFQYKTRMAQAEALRQLLLDEVKTYSELRRDLLQRHVTAEATERLRIRRDLEWLSDTMRHVKICDQAIGILQDEPESVETEPGQITEIPLSWMDRFAEFSKKHNEPWREDLLARALARESGKTGSINPRTIWLIGTLEERTFHAFAALLDVSMVVDSAFVIYSRAGDMLKKQIPCTYSSNLVPIGELTFICHDAGLIGDILTSYVGFSTKGSYFTYYAAKKHKIICRSSPLEIRGIVPSHLGLSIAQLYIPKNNEVGAILYDDFIARLDRSKYEVEEIT